MESIKQSAAFERQGEMNVEAAKWEEGGEKKKREREREEKRKGERKEERRKKRMMMRLEKERERKGSRSAGAGRSCDSDKNIEGKQSSAQWAGNAKFLHHLLSKTKLRRRNESKKHWQSTATPDGPMTWHAIVTPAPHQLSLPTPESQQLQQQQQPAKLQLQHHLLHHHHPQQLWMLVSERHQATQQSTKALSPCLTTVVLLSLSLAS